MQALMLLSAYLLPCDRDDLFTNGTSAIGLQFGWKSSAVVTCILPFIAVALFKVHINRNFARSFKYYVPTESELHDARIRAQARNIKENHSENCVGHPALHEALRTPVLYENMMPLLAQVYSGRLDSEQTTTRECSEQQIEVCVLPGGIQIARIDQSDLEYDPVLY
jgi:calcium permeable stress-gated cation channel